jgi:hypothetical protein
MITYIRDIEKLGKYSNGYLTQKQTVALLSSTKLLSPLVHTLS